MRETDEFLAEPKEQKKIYEQIFDSALDGLLILDNGKFTDCNQSIVKMLKYDKKEDLLNIHPSELSPERQPDGRLSFEKANEMIALAYKSRGHRFEWVHTKATGENFWAEIILTPIFLNNKEILYVVWRDISERKKLEKENAVIKERMELAFKGSGDGFWDWNIVDDTIYLSVEWKAMLGYKDDELENTFYTWQNLVHPDDLEQALKDMQLNIDGKTDTYRNKHRLRHKEGHWIWIYSRGKLLHKDGRAVRMIGTHTDITQEKEKELKLIYQAQIIEQISDGVITTNLEGNIVSWNTGAEKLFEYSQSEVIGKHISMIYRQEDIPSLTENIRASLSDTDLYNGDLLFVKKSKNTISVALSLSSLKDENGKIIGRIGINQDITQRKKAEETLQKLNNTLEEQKNTFKSEAKRFQNILDQIPEIAVQGYDEQHNIIYWNHASEDFYGYSRDEALGKKLEDLIIPNTMCEKINKLICNWVDNGIKIPSAELILKDKYNNPITVFSQHVLIETARGEKEMYCLDIDLRYIKETEEKLQQSEKALQILNNDLEKKIEIAVADLKKSQLQAKLGSWQHDILDQKLTWSDETYHIFELEKTSDIASYKNFLAVIYPDDMEKVKAAYDHSLKTKEPYEIVHRLLMRDGRIKYVREHCETTFDSAGNALISIGTVQDITSEYLAAEKLREKKDMLFKQSRLAQMGEMISMIAHQWRQPLSAISATTNTLILKNERSGYESELFEDRLQKIANYSQHLSTTIDDFRNFFKTNKEKEETTVETVIEDVLHITRTLLESKNINIITDFKYNKKVNIYANELKQVLLNLIKNAEDILLENKVVAPEITVRTFEEDGYSVLSIEDNGGGIDNAIINKVFDPYFSTKLDREGTGLGLYMSKVIMQEHCAGTLTVKNGRNGAIFRIQMRGKDV